MLNQHKITDQLYHWLKTFVEIPHPQLGNWPPCPFARQARLDSTMVVKFCEVNEFQKVIQESIQILTQKEVVVVCFDHTQINSAELQLWVEQINKSSLMPMGFVVLEDHPDYPEYVNGIKMNFNYCGLLVIQSLKKLNYHADQLRNKGYYNCWDQPALDQIVAWRYQ